MKIGITLQLDKLQLPSQEFLNDCQTRKMSRNRNEFGASNIIFNLPIFKLIVDQNAKSLILYTIHVLLVHLETLQQRTHAYHLVHTYSAATGSLYGSITSATSGIMPCNKINGNKIEYQTSQAKSKRRFAFKIAGKKTSFPNTNL